jgi:hypothetical protein
MWTNGSASGWTSADIGSPTPAGAAAFDAPSGTWTVSGGGNDIGGTSDQFHLVSQSLSGSGGVSARVATQTSTSSAAKAGVMLRTGADPAAPYYAAFVSPGGGVTVQARAGQGAATATLVTQPGAVPARLWVGASGNGFATYVSNDGYVWQRLAGSSATLNLGPTVLAGLAVTSHNTGQLSSAAFDAIAVTNSPPAPAPPVPCPAPFTCADIGAPTPAGSQSFDPGNGVWTLSAGGTDITGTADHFHFVWQTSAGGSVRARVTAQTNAGAQAKAGVMLRASSDAASPYYGVFVSPGAGIKVQERTTLGGPTTKLANPGGVVPVFLKVSRSANTFTAYTSSDGSTWTLIPGSTFTGNLGATPLEGLAATSHNGGALCTVTYDAVVTG